MRFASTLPDLIPSRLREKGPDDKSRSANNIPKTNDKSVFCSSMCAGCGEEAPGLGARDGKGQSRGAQASPARGHCLAASLALPPPRQPYPRSKLPLPLHGQSARLALAGPTPQHHTAHASVARSPRFCCPRRHPSRGVRRGGHPPCESPVLSIPLLAPAYVRFLTGCVPQGLHSLTGDMSGRTLLGTPRTSKVVPAGWSDPQLGGGGPRPP